MTAKVFILAGWTLMRSADTRNFHLILDDIKSSILIDYSYNVLARRLCGTSLVTNILRKNCPAVEKP